MLISRSAACTAACLTGVALLESATHAQCTGWKSVPRPAGVVASVPSEGFLATLDFGPPGLVGDVIVSSGTMCSGQFPQLNCSSVFLFNGTAWLNLGTPAPISGSPAGFVRAAAPLDGALIIGGGFSAMAETQSRNLAVWRDGAWSEFAGGANGPVLSLLNWSGGIVAAGAFREIGGVPTSGVAMWNGETWHDLGAPAVVNDYRFLLVYRGALSVVSSQTYSLLSFINGTWTSVTPQCPIGLGKNWLAIGDQIVVGRAQSGGYSNTAIWDGTSWRTTCVPRPCPALGQTDVQGLAAYDIDRDGSIGAVSNGSILYSFDQTRYEATLGSSSGTRFDVVMAEGNAAPGGPLTVWAGELSTVFRRYVNGFPTIYSQPSNTTACGRRNATFSTIITNTLTPPTCRWQRNGIDLTDGTTPWGSIIIGSDSSQLTIRSPRPQDLGTYRCIITNATCGSAQTRDATLTGCQADFNCDGQADFTDYLDFIDHFANESPAADFDASGTVDFFDYLDVVEALNIGC